MACVFNYLWDLSVVGLGLVRGLVLVNVSGLRAEISK